MIKPFARGSFPEGSKRQHHFSFCFVILNMAWAWSDSMETCPIHLRADRYSWQELPWLIQQGTRSTTPMISLHCYCCCPSLFTSTGSACQPRYVWSSWAAVTNITLLFLSRAAASWLGRCMDAECGVCKGTGTHSLCNTWKDREKCPRLSWSALEATSQPGTAVSAG